MTGVGCNGFGGWRWGRGGVGWEDTPMCQSRSLTAGMQNPPCPRAAEHKALMAEDLRLENQL